MGAKIISAILWCVVFSVSALPVSAKAAEVAPQLRAVLARSVPDEKIPVIATLSRSEELVAQARGFGRKHRDSLVRELKERSQRGRAELEGFLRKYGIEDATELWLINGIALQADPKTLAALSEHPAVDTLYFDETRQLSPEPRLSFPVHGWNISQVGAYELWDMGHSGAGAVVAVLDSGVDLEHPDLGSRWRGPADVGWFDPYDDSPEPFDQIIQADPESPDSQLGHGTAVTGIIVAGDEFGLPLGMAPDSKWIAARIFGPDNTSSSSKIIKALEWTLDPNEDGNTADAADIVNNSWGIVVEDDQNGIEPERCIETYRRAIQGLKTAGVAVVAAAGNSGPDPFTSESPGNYPEVLAVGATDDEKRVTDFSARGPSACDDGVYPQLVAPGTMIMTTNATAVSNYVTVAGTSFSAAHLSGALALLRGAFPDVDMAAIEDALLVSAVDLGVSEPDNSYGHGLIDVPAAYDHLLTPVLAAPTNGAMVDGPEVTLRWEQLHDSRGYPLSAQVRIATDDDFSEATNVTASAASSTSLLWAGAAGLFLCSPLSRRRTRSGRIVRTLLIVIALGFGMPACGGGGGGGGGGR
ncbi:S8 family peptidase [Geoalkalibacter subterraneus]|nr:S8 family serine peptidase [Geoalkalibacter subterraneus]